MRRPERKRGEKAQGEEAHKVVNWIVNGVVVTEIKIAEVSTDLNSPTYNGQTARLNVIPVLTDFNSPTDHDQNLLCRPLQQRNNPLPQILPSTPDYHLKRLRNE